ncbi:MAG: DUF2188 domain-containing protein [Bacillota bacterium]
MGIFSKLFGRKKKDTKKVENEPQKEEKKTESADEVTLQEVNESLDEVNTISKDEPAKETVTPSPKEDEATKAEPASKPEPEPKEKDETPLYHIKKHSEGWQVIKEGADKAYRVFNYQKEAIDFAKKENLEYQVYKADGTLRK